MKVHSVRRVLAGCVLTASLAAQCQTYCAAGVQNVCSGGGLGSNEYIARVVFAGIDNSSPSPWPNCFSSSGYENYTAISGVVVRGGNYALTVQVALFAIVTNLFVTAWVDWDGDGVFAPSEATFTCRSTGSSTVFTGTVHVPASAVCVTRMRIRLGWHPGCNAYLCSGQCPTGTPSPCGVVPYGNVEDYSVVVANSGPQYQLNNLLSTLVVGGATGSACSPAVLSGPAGAPTTLFAGSSLLGSPWEIAFSPRCLVPNAGAGQTTPAGWILNLDPVPPWTFLFGGAAPAPVPFPGSATYPSLLPPVPGVISMQQFLADPSAPDGIALSAPTEVRVQ